MNTAPKSERMHIGIFGRRNAGKSSLINALTGQDIALVSETAGTTTDPVYKSMEILPIGPVVIIDTAGLDDSGDLGGKRVKKSLDVLKKCDFAVVVVPANTIAGDSLQWELDLIERIAGKNIPCVLAVNKIDIAGIDESAIKEKFKNIPFASVSALNGTGIDRLKELLISESDSTWHEDTILGDLISPGDTIVLVVPIDDAAPKGRLILPQVQTIRDILDHDAVAVTVKERELAHVLHSIGVTPRLVVTDSQAFQKVSADTPEHIPMTSFSILFARYKGDLLTYLRGIKKIDSLRDGDKVLIAEACTHHVQSDDIGTVKIPRWLNQLTGKKLEFEKFSGCGYPDDLTDYRLVIHCGSCMLNRRETVARARAAENAGVSITNYGMVIAYSFGILERALKPFAIAQAYFSGDIY
ncbi:MAG: [FeFe] hydrogenase H-cluster maturation GTPase HydF [Spirochaetes bacterium GWF1_51_8]|nr:MAG: [FeFe] hydrogenase H-cluster maturation GTPase HydF [Spirochaetes bacterium GWF1_51_8]